MKEKIIEAINDLRVTMIDFIMDNDVENTYTYNELSEMSTDDLFDEIVWL